MACLRRFALLYRKIHQTADRHTIVEVVQKRESSLIAPRSGHPRLDVDAALADRGGKLASRTDREMRVEIGKKSRFADVQQQSGRKAVR